MRDFAAQPRSRSTPTRAAPPIHPPKPAAEGWDEEEELDEWEDEEGEEEDDEWLEEDEEEF